MTADADTDKSFWAAYEDALESARKIVEERGKSYAGGVGESILDYWDSEMDILYEVRKKALRTHRMIKHGETLATDRLIDNIVDGINYYAFLYAWVKTKK